MWRWARINIVCGLLLPMIALAQEPVSPPAPATPEVDEKINEPGTADTTPPDPTMLAPNRLDPLSDDPGQQSYDPTKPKERPEFAYEIPDPVTVPFIDRLHVGVWNTVWRSSMRTDQWFGSSGRRVPLPASQRLDRARPAVGQV